MISHKAAAVAVIVAFLTGLIGSLAVRPPGPVSGASSTVTEGAENTESVRIQWRVPLYSPRSLPLVGMMPDEMADDIRRISRGAIDLKPIDPGEVVPVFAITDAVRDGKVEAGYTWVGYDQGKIPASPLISSIPFGMEPVEFVGWWLMGGGQELGEALYHPHNVHPVLCGMIGPETAGWFKAPLQSMDDLDGLKIRFAGLGGRILEAAGASVTLLPAGEIFQALEKGAIDASEFSQPIMDQALGFDRVAQYNHFPGWHQPSSSSHLLVNLDTWNQTREEDRLLIEMACSQHTLEQLAKTEAAQGKVLAELEARGISTQRLPESLLRDLKTLSDEVMEAEAAKDPMFRKILDSQEAFRRDFARWTRLAYLPRDLQ